LNDDSEVSGMGAALVKDVLAYGVSVLALGYVIYVMLHPDVDEASSCALGEWRQRNQQDADVLQWCAEQWRRRGTERRDPAHADSDFPAAISGTHR
jgi:hypothetical protein